ncbi:MAG: hypothetical protein IJW59_03195 [Clostridia bacterium]|nr:hypothetical protein [Clostridia bacterium]
MEAIKILSEDKIIALKTNLSTIKNVMSECPNNEWLKDFFKEEEPFTSSKYTIKNFELITNKENKQETDCENAKILYENLKHLPDSVLCDERLWVSLGFGKLYDFLMYRWNPCEDKGTTRLEYRWLFKYTYKRSLFFHGIAKLFWQVKFTYDETLENPYELTDFCFQIPEILEKMIFRNYSNSKTIRLAILRAIKKFVEDGGNYSSKFNYEIMKYISFLGGAYILDAFTQEELAEKVYDKLIDLFVEANPQQKVFKLD